MNELAAAVTEDLKAGRIRTWLATLGEIEGQIATGSMR